MQRFRMPHDADEFRVVVFGFSVCAILVFVFVVFGNFLRFDISVLCGAASLFSLFIIALASLVAVELLWELFGVEVIEVDAERIVIQHTIFGLGVSKKLFVKKINGLFLSRQEPDGCSDLYFSSREYRFWSFKRGQIAINCGKTIWGGVQTFRFGGILGEPDARQIVSLVHRRFPQYMYRPDQS